MIEQLQSLMKALEAGSYKAAPQKYVWNPSTSAEEVVNIDNGTAFQRNCDCPEVDERGVGKHGCHVKKEREPNDPYRYYLGDHIWEHHK